jgi:hypothetical protein
VDLRSSPTPTPHAPPQFCLSPLRNDALSRGLACAYEKGEQLTLADLLRVQALLRVRQARRQEAVDALEESLALSRAMQYPYAEAKTLYIYGQHYAANGEPE